ncbi:tagaturonate reductase (plasmid) [Pedobacter sp. BS3]|uniref:tagaturonate reductase n=1 Tax=Pedobacter sp. BS3 TaxID=2567937 RepID=UPI0011EDE69B|nr:tagaturonate reductase [Pedobacter sp. BS3]TZF85943.1 tagaturonate reductase [Pedobacter sp. BS3]
MILSKDNLKHIDNAGVNVPDEALFHLPEKVLQFGTGVLLRGLPAYFIDKANRQGIFNGRIAVVKSTNHGSTDDFDNQDNLYTLCIRGIENGQKIEEDIICSAISRVITATKQWDDILAIAASKDLEIVISNTTEVGIQYVEEDITQGVPDSFPGKLTAVLYHRFKAFNGDKNAGLIIVPTELIPDNGKKLRNIVVRLARFNRLEEDFISWLQASNTFCDSLVDRIVPGKPDKETAGEFFAQAGYTDNLIAVAEVYRLWAIEGDEHVKEKLSFAQADAGVIIAPDIEIYRELKLRLLNGTHTLSCGLAFLAGFETVKNAMDNEDMEQFISHLMLDEIAPAIPYAVSPEEARDFSVKVLDRFRNQEIKHAWLAITVQYSMKMRMRVVPVLLNHYKLSSAVPEHIATGFAAYLLFLKPVRHEHGKYYGSVNGLSYLITDDYAGYFYEQWQKHPDNELVSAVLANKQLWGEDLTQLSGFEQAVAARLRSISRNGVLPVLQHLKNSIVQS